VTHEGAANEASIDEAVVDEAMVDEKAMMEVAMAAEKERATKTKERAAIERIAVVITLDRVAPIVVAAGIVRVVILGRCGRRAEGGGERARSKPIRDMRLNTRSVGDIRPGATQAR
jgi:hypothetical protein